MKNKNSTEEKEIILRNIHFLKKITYITAIDSNSVVILMPLKKVLMSWAVYEICSKITAKNLSTLIP
jgi:hypothetical protein